MLFDISLFSSPLCSRSRVSVVELLSIFGGKGGLIVVPSLGRRKVWF